MIRSIFTLLSIAIASPMFAQEGALSYTPSPADSLRHAHDSIVAAANTAIMGDSSLIDEYQKIIAVFKHRKNYDLELTVAARMMAANPASALAYFAYGDAQLDNGAPELAIEPLGKALIVEPAFVRARVTLAEAYTMKQLYDTALMHLDTALFSNPRYAQAHLQRASVLTHLGRDNDAVESLRAAAELLPESFPHWMKLARALFQNGKYEEALDALKYALTLNDNSPDALYLYAETNEMLGNVEEAVRAFEDFMLRFPTDRRALEAERNARSLGARP